MEQTGKSSRKLWFVVVGLVVVAVIVIGAVYAIVGNGTKKEASTTTTTSSKTQSADTAAKVSQDMQDLQSSLKQATKDQAAAKAIIDSSKNQIKVGQ